MFFLSNFHYKCILKELEFFNSSTEDMNNGQWALGYAKFGNDENFHLFHLRYTKPMIENRYLILFFACNFFSQYQIRLKILKFKIQQKVLYKKDAEV